jgi:hypothetical protein
VISIWPGPRHGGFTCGGAIACFRESALVVDAVFDDAVFDDAVFDDAVFDDAVFDQVEGMSASRLRPMALA